LPALSCVVKIVRKRTPRPSVQANSEPMVTSSARALSPRRPMTMPPRIVAAKTPARMLRPRTAAARPPVKATWLRASPAKTWARRTTK
jgi:hypothetical protein